MCIKDIYNISNYIKNTNIKNIYISVIKHLKIDL